MGGRSEREKEIWKRFREISDSEFGGDLRVEGDLREEIQREICEARFGGSFDSEARSEMEGRARLDRGMDEIAESRKQIEDLKYMLSEKSR